MSKWPRSWIQKARYYSGLAALYALTIGGGWYLLFQHPHPAVAAYTPPPSSQASPPAPTSTQPKFTLHTGKPTRIIAPEAAIDLPVHEGFYDEASGAWTLDDYHAFYAMPTLLANNHSGMTLIYGHGTDAVFSRLATTHFTPGVSTVEVHTDTQEKYLYTFESSRDTVPNDMSIFSYQGPPIVVLQTCTGAFSEWRSLYVFTFTSVEPLS